MTSLITFLSIIQMSVIGMSEWPYMQKLDPLSTATFFGYVTALSSLGQALCAPIFGYWGSATGSVRQPLIAGRIIALIGCFIYICLEMFTTNRRYIMLICYAFFGMSMASMGVLRAYLARISTAEDRPKACSYFSFSLVLAVSVGPIFQLLFTPLSYPGWNIFSNVILLNIYTGPIYVAIFANIASLIVIIFFFKEYRQRAVEKKGLQRRPSKAKAALTTDLKTLNLKLVALCIIVRMSTHLTYVTTHTISSPLMMSAFNWSNTHTVKVSSVLQTSVGVISLTVFAGFATGRLSKIISMRFATLISLCLFCLYYLLTFPWPFLGSTIQIKNDALNITGCDPDVYKWCLTSTAVNPYTYVLSTIVVLGIAVSFAIISLDTIYSLVLGKIDQGTMQGVFLCATDAVSIAGPLIIAPLFELTGQKYVWTIDGIAIVFAASLWMLNYQQIPSAKKK
uniref:MFS domain-containing protein n=1 Tax=Syphacia muris TaxID=451379 RepID=A0A158R488_9BILA